METSNSGASFAVDDVGKCPFSLPRVKAEKNLKNLLRGKVESHYEPEGGVIDYGMDYEGSCLNGFLAAVDLAYRKHYPLILSPDIIWLATMQGFAKHVNKNAEKLRDMFVSHQGKKLIKVRRDDFAKGDASNPWPEVFDEFVNQIRKYVGESNMDLIMPSFSTTGDLEKAVASVTLMDAMQSYFEYECCSLCGIPNVTLTGKLEDWEDVKSKTEQLKKYDAEFWASELNLILDEFVHAVKGQPRKEFWKNIYKINGGSGGPYINGWILNFFPYFEIAGGVYQNGCLAEWRKSNPWTGMHGIKTDAFPSGISSAPFIWKYFNKKFKMRFASGFIGVQQDNETMSLWPQIGWAILDENDVKEKCIIH